MIVVVRNSRSGERATTLHDVANRVGVSPRTVSRVVNDQGGFSEATRDRVMLAVADMRYRPNLMARGLITRRSSTIAFISPVLTDPFFPEVAEGVQNAAGIEGLTMLCAVNEHKCDVEHAVLDRLSAHAPEGLIIFPAGGDASHLVKHLDQGTRMVVIDAPIDHPNAVSVMSDLTNGATSAVEHLLGRGCRQLAMLASVSSPHPRLRETAFLAALPSGMTRIVERVDPTLAGGRDETTRLLREHPEIDGIFAYNDMMAIGALEAMRTSGLTAPTDIAVIGCDGIDLGGVVTPALSTILIDRDNLGRQAVAALLQMMTGEPMERSIVVPVELLLRESA